MSFLLRTLHNLRVNTRKILSRLDVNHSQNWQDHLLSLYFIRMKDGICLFSHHFQIGINTQIDMQLVGMGFCAFTNMLKEIVDKNASINSIDLGKKQILVERRKRLLVVLITTAHSTIFRKKLIEVTNLFEKIFELQLQLYQSAPVIQEDYLLAINLIELVFNENSTSILSIVPVILKSIQRSKSSYPKQYFSVPDIVAETITNNSPPKK